MTVLEFMKSMREQFGHFEFKAVSPEGNVIKSKGWNDRTYRVETVAPITEKPKVKK